MLPSVDVFCTPSLLPRNVGMRRAWSARRIPLRLQRCACFTCLAAPARFITRNPAGAPRCLKRFLCRCFATIGIARARNFCNEATPFKSDAGGKTQRRCFGRLQRGAPTQRARNFGGCCERGAKRCATDPLDLQLGRDPLGDPRDPGPGPPLLT